MRSVFDIFVEKKERTYRVQFRQLPSTTTITVGRGGGEAVARADRIGTMIIIRVDCGSSVEQPYCALNRVYSICNIDSSAHAFRLGIFPAHSHVCSRECVCSFCWARVYSNLNRMAVCRAESERIRFMQRMATNAYAERMIPFHTDIHTHTNASERVFRMKSKHFIK